MTIAWTIRPRYQREFVYKDAKRDAVIDTVLQWLPLNVMYWAKQAMTRMKFLMANSAP